MFAAFRHRNLHSLLIGRLLCETGVRPLIPYRSGSCSSTSGLRTSPSRLSQMEIVFERTLTYSSSSEGEIDKL